MRARRAGCESHGLIEVGGCDGGCPYLVRNVLPQLPTARRLDVKGALLVILRVVSEPFAGR
jgi:hypothetical protein